MIRFKRYSKKLKDQMFIRLLAILIFTASIVYSQPSSRDSIKISAIAAQNALDAKDSLQAFKTVVDSQQVVIVRCEQANSSCTALSDSLTVQNRRYQRQSSTDSQLLTAKDDQIAQKDQAIEAGANKIGVLKTLLYVLPPLCLIIGVLL